MKSFRKFCSNSFVVAPLILLMLFVSVQCSTPESIAKASYSGEDLFRGVVFMDGEISDKITLFKKIKGHYAFESDVEVMKQYRVIIDEVMTVMKTDNASFFAQFKREIESGDHLRVQQILDRGVELLHASLLKAPTVSNYYQDALELSEKINTDGLIGADGEVNQQKMDEIENLVKEKTKNGKTLSSRTQACSLVAVCVVWIYVAAVQSAAVGVSVAFGVAVAIYAGVWLWTAATRYSYTMKRTASDGDKLQKELLIEEITKSFAVI